MDEAQHSRWWKLHLRTTLGEKLSADEAAEYERGTVSLDHDERLDNDLSGLRLQRDKIEAVERAQAQLHAQQLSLAAEISELEARLSHRARQALGVSD